MGVRNYDHIAVPKNTKNCFSTEEIYQQAFGKNPEVNKPFERQGYSNHVARHDDHQSTHQSPRLVSPSQNLISPRYQALPDHAVSQFQYPPPAVYQAHVLESQLQSAQPKTMFHQNIYAPYLNTQY